MLLQTYRKDYQLVAKKQGAKGIPPFSSPVLLSFLFWLALWVFLPQSSGCTSSLKYWQIKYGFRSTRYEVNTKYERASTRYEAVQKTKTSTCYMLLQTYCKDYQLVTKKQGVKGFPPLSSYGPPFPSVLAGALGVSAPQGFRLYKREPLHRSPSDNESLIEHRS